MSLPIERGKECLVGWRGWQVFQPGLIVTTSTVWLPEQRVEAVCTRTHVEGDRCPSETCTCGIYSFKKPVQIFQQNYAFQPLLGEVWLWGKVVECNGGFRAEYAYPKKFYATKDMLKPAGQKTEGLIEYVAFRYGVELEIIESTHALVSESAEVRAEKAKREAEKKAAQMQETLRQRAATRQGKQVLENKAKSLPSSDPKRWKNMLEEINWLAAEAARKKLGGAR